MKERWRMRDSITPWFGWIFASTTIAVVGFVAFPGCATPTTSSSPAVEAMEDQRDAYGSAMSTMAKKKRRGELPGIEPTAAGTFSGTWLWYDQRNRYAEHQIRVVFKYADGRPNRSFKIVSSTGSWPPDWQPVPIAKD